MASYVDRGDHLIESWFRPPATFSASLGGWSEEYFRRMQDYSQLVCFASLMPVTDAGEVVGDQLHMRLRSQDLRRLRRHVADLVRLHFAGGADEVYLPSARGMTVRPSDPIDEIIGKHFRDSHDFLPSTAHPQDGNPMGRSAQNSVVSSDLRVHGCRNLYVADAGIFPSSIRANPQLAIMGIAHAAFAG